MRHQSESNSNGDNIKSNRKDNCNDLKKDKSTSINHNYAENHPSQVDCPQPNQASQPSKRAKMMLNAAMNPSQDIMKKEKKNLFTNTNNILQNKLSNFALASRNNLEKNINSLNANGSKNDRNHENINNSNNNNFLKKSTKIITKKYDCLICKNVALEPCAARCGHICCESCWLRWLKVKETCPLCRAPTLLDQIKKNRKKSIESVQSVCH